MGPFAFAQTGGSPKRGGRLTIGADADPIGLDPITVTAFSSFDFTSLLYTGLLRWTPDMKVEPDLAVGYEQPTTQPTSSSCAGCEVPQRPGARRRGREVHLRPHHGPGTGSPTRPVFSTASVR